LVSRSGRASLSPTRISVRALPDGTFSCHPVSEPPGDRAT
jgi:hypothetical protein